MTQPDKSAEKKDGGHAFPQPSDVMGRGMSLRDYFAAAAMQGILAARIKSDEAPHVAPLAYQYADAMIAERDKT